jgi:hypothetical protein
MVQAVQRGSHGSPQQQIEIGGLATAKPDAEPTAWRAVGTRRIDKPFEAHHFAEPLAELVLSRPMAPLRAA